MGLMIDDEDLLNFSFDGEDDEEIKPPSSSSFDFSYQHPDDSFPEFAEEELEWLSNKDAFPAIETCLDILSNPTQNNISSSHSYSNSTITSCCGTLQVPINYPVRKRSKRRRRRRRAFPELPTQQCCLRNQVKVKHDSQLTFPVPRPPAVAGGLGRRCQHCLAEKTPQWRAGPMGPKTLCNACGVRYKSGRLLPEYRPASSPTFSGILHSNSHRKVIEMRRHKLDGGTEGKEAFGNS